MSTERSFESDPSGEVIRLPDETDYLDGLTGDVQTQLDGKEAADADLAAIAALSSNGLIARTADGAVAARSIAGGTGVTVTNPAGTAGNPTVTVGSITVNGTANRVTVSGSPVAPGGTVTLSGPQDLHTGASPTFAGTVFGAAGGSISLSASLGLLLAGSTGSSWDFALATPGIGSAIFIVPTGTRLVDFQDSISVKGNANQRIYSGSGDPNNVVSASLGSIYMRSDGGANTSFYVKESNSGGNTGWTPK